MERNPEKSKKGIYVVSDPFFRMWFGAIHPYMSFFEFGETEPAYSRIEPLINRLIAECYEDVCRQWIREMALVFNATQVGRQWSSAYEIDVAAVNTKFELTAVGECKWSENKVGISILSQLEAKILSHNLPLAEDCRFILFSKSGFESELQELAAGKKNIVLVSGSGL